MEANREQLLQRAETVRTETQPGANNAGRIGQLLADIIRFVPSMQYALMTRVTEEDLDGIHTPGTYIVGPTTSYMEVVTPFAVCYISHAQYASRSGEAYDYAVQEILRFGTDTSRMTAHRQIRVGTSPLGKNQWEWTPWEDTDAALAKRVDALEGIPAKPYGKLGLSLCGAGKAADYALASGNGSRALGPSSVAAGFHTLAQNAGETAAGSYNNSRTGNTDAEQTIWSVGNGSAEGARSNAAELRRNGDLYVGNRIIAYAGKEGKIDITGYIKNLASRVTAIERTAWNCPASARPLDQLQPGENPSAALGLPEGTTMDELVSAIGACAVVRVNSPMGAFGTYSLNVQNAYDTYGRIALVAPCLAEPSTTDAVYRLRIYLQNAGGLPSVEAVSLDEIPF